MAFTNTATLNNWKQAWNLPVLRKQIILGSVLLLIILGLLPFFLNKIEKKKGITLNDPVLAIIPAHNMTWAIFIVVAGMVMFILIRAINKPFIYINYIWGIIIVTIVRLLAINLVPLNPPVGIIILDDPISGLLYGGKVITKDLFFSGHTAMMVLIALCLERKGDKIIATISVIVVALLLLIQHIHYTIDIIAAPVIVYPLYRLSKFILKTKSDSLI